MVRNSDLAAHPLIRKNYPVLSEALLSGASPQLRNMASVGGNLMQRTRCTYFRDPSYPCNKRTPGAGCAALHGYTRGHAVLGTSDRCIASFPGDMPVAMAALDAVVRTRRPHGGERTIPLADFYVAYGDDPARETVLEHGELITAVELPATPWFARSHYLKVRDRASYEFALASAAVALDLDERDGGRIRDCRIALGGVGSKPWRSREAEQALAGARAEEGTYQKAAEGGSLARRPPPAEGQRISRSSWRSAPSPGRWRRPRRRRYERHESAGSGRAAGRPHLGGRPADRSRRRPSQDHRRRPLCRGRPSQGARLRDDRAEHHREGGDHRDRHRRGAPLSRRPHRPHPRERPRAEEAAKGRQGRSAAVRQDGGGPPAAVGQRDPLRRPARRRGGRRHPGARPPRGGPGRRPLPRGEAGARPRRRRDLPSWARTWGGRCSTIAATPKPLSRLPVW